MPPPLTYINIGPHGTFKKSGAVQTTSADIDQFLDYVKLQAVTKLVIHFHGGLISEKSGLAIAQKMAPLYRDAGAVPVTVVWETGLLETFRSNLTKIHQTRVFQKILVWVLKKAAARLGVGVDAKGVGVEMTDDQVLAELKSDALFENMQIGVGARGGGGPVSEAALPAMQGDVAAELELEIDEDFLALVDEPGQNQQIADAMSEPGAAGAKGAVTAVKAAWAVAKIVVRVVRRFIDKRDHGFYPTVIEEILREYYLADLGGWLWTGMKDAGADMWKDNAGLIGDARHAGRYFIEGLAAVQQATNVKVDLVAHSAGAVAICRLLNVAAANLPQLKFRNVLLLAPAVRSDVFHAEVVSFPARFDSLRIFTMSDAFESADRLAGPVYTRSLLYLISGVLEGTDDEPIVGMERYLSGASPYDSADLNSIRTFLTAPNRLVLAKTTSPGVDGLRSESVRHGDFDDDPLTRASLVHIIQQ